MPRVALVPDPLLQRVPFALLPWSPVDDDLVVERAATVLCPSLAACGAGEAAVPAGARVAALHAGQGGAGLAVLPAAREEAERIGRRYAGADVATATESAFAAALAGADVVHFSGHAVPDERYPGRSELLLASDGGDGVRVPLARLFGPPVRAALVVLSACRTSRAEARRGEGGIGVAGEFLRAGVRQVLATQWDVRDDVAGEVMDLVHEALASGATPWDAVRHAQRIVRRDGGRAPRDWAGYVAYTSVSFR
jgi:CHAT domain-containing protein